MAQVTTAKIKMDRRQQENRIEPELASEINACVDCTDEAPAAAFITEYKVYHDGHAWQ